MYKYKTWDDDIEKVEVFKETAKSVWVKDCIGTRFSRVSKSSRWGIYHNTWKKAHDYVFKRCKQQIEFAERRLIEAKADLEAVKKQKEIS